MSELEGRRMRLVLSTPNPPRFLSRDFWFWGRPTETGGVGGPERPSGTSAHAESPTPALRGHRPGAPAPEDAVFMTGEAPAFLSPEPTCLGSLLACVPDQAAPTPEAVPEPEVVALLRRLGARAPSLVSVGPLMQRLGEAALPTVLRVATTDDMAVRLGAGRWCRLLADQLQKGGRLAQAETACAHAAELLSRLADEHPQRHFLRAEMITIRIAIAEFRRRLGRWEEALRDLEGARRLAELLLAEHPSVKTYRRILAICLHELGRALHRAGRVGESEARLREAVQHQAGLVAVAPDGRNYRADLERMQRTLHLFQRPCCPSPAAEEPGR